VQRRLAETCSTAACCSLFTVENVYDFRTHVMSFVYYALVLSYVGDTHNDKEEEWKTLSGAVNPCLPRQKYLAY